MLKYIAWFIGSFLLGCVALAVVFAVTNDITRAGWAMAVVFGTCVALMI